MLAATNKIPDEAVARGELRSDLYYRLNVFNIHMPPLREHKEDIDGLVKLLLAEMSEKHGRKPRARAKPARTAARAKFRALPGPPPSARYARR